MSFFLSSFFFLCTFPSSFAKGKYCEKKWSFLVLDASCIMLLGVKEKKWGGGGWKIYRPQRGTKNANTCSFLSTAFESGENDDDAAFLSPEGDSYVCSFPRYNYFFTMAAAYKSILSDAFFMYTSETHREREWVPSIKHVLESTDFLVFSPAAFLCLFCCMWTLLTLFFFARCNFRGSSKQTAKREWSRISNVPYIFEPLSMRIFENCMHVELKSSGFSMRSFNTYWQFFRSDDC